jgi:hypothetical protein
LVATAASRSADLSDDRDDAVAFSRPRSGATFIRGELPLVPSPDTPGEGEDEGGFRAPVAFETPNHPHPNPLPAYRERGQRQPITSIERHTPRRAEWAVCLWHLHRDTFKNDPFKPE